LPKAGVLPSCAYEDTPASRLTELQLLLVQTALCCRRALYSCGCTLFLRDDVLSRTGLMQCGALFRLQTSNHQRWWNRHFASQRWNAFWL